MDKFDYIRIILIGVPENTEFYDSFQNGRLVAWSRQLTDKLMINNDIQLYLANYFNPPNRSSLSRIFPIFSELTSACSFHWRVIFGLCSRVSRRTASRIISTYQDSHFGSHDVLGASRSELDADCRSFGALYTRHTFAFATRTPGPRARHIPPTLHLFVRFEWRRSHHSPLKQTRTRKRAREW